MKNIRYIERTRPEYPAQWKATTDKGEVLTIIQGQEITVIDGKDEKVLFKTKSPKNFGIDIESLKTATAEALSWPPLTPHLAPQDSPACSHCKGGDKVIEVVFKTPGRVNRYYSERTRLCDPCRKGLYKARFKKV